MAFWIEMIETNGFSDQKLLVFPLNQIKQRSFCIKPYLASIKSIPGNDMERDRENALLYSINYMAVQRV